MTQTLPPLNWLRVFEAAARFQSFARAATDLNMSAAAVSQQIRALETRLNTQLFTRHAHAVSLTDIGFAYLPAVQQALVSLQEATDGIFGAAHQQSLFVQAVPLFAHGFLAQGVAEFTAQHPQVSLTLSTENTALDHINRYFDLRITFGTPTGTGERTEPLLGERLFPVATPALAAGVKDPADLLTHPLIEVTSHRAGWPYLFDHLGFALRAARYVHTDSTLMACAMAARGAGIALARAPASDVAVAMAGLVPCLDGFSVAGADRYHLRYPGHQPLRRPAQVFREWLHVHCSADEGKERDRAPV